MDIEATSLEGVKLLTPQRRVDTRGWFSESWNVNTLSRAGIECAFVQDNHSRSEASCTLRGLHYQHPPHAQDKLVSCVRGAILDVVVDVRLGSPDYTRWLAVKLTEEKGNQLFIPKGFLHGFVTLVDDTEVQYKCSDFYAPEHDGAVRWDSLDIDWGLSRAPILSPKDAHAPTFDEWTSPFNYVSQA